MSAYLAVLIALGSVWVFVFSPSVFVKSGALATILLALAHVIRFERAWLEAHLHGSGAVIRAFPRYAARILTPAFFVAFAVAAYASTALPYAAALDGLRIMFPIVVVLGIALAWMHYGGAHEMLAPEAGGRAWLAPLLLILILAGGYWLRAAHLSDGFLNVDEGISGIAAEAFAETGSPTMPSGKIYGREILSTALIASGISVFGFDEFGARIAGVTFGMLTVLLAFFLGRAVADRRVGLVFAALMALSFVMIEYSTFARMYVFLAFFFTLTMYCAVRFFDQRSLLWLSLTALSAVLCFLSHRIGFIALPIPLLMAMYAWRAEYGRIARTRLSLIVAVLALLVLIGIALFPLLHEAFLARVYQNQTPYRFGAMFSEIGRSYQLIADALGLAAALVPMGALFVAGHLRRAGRDGVLLLLVYAFVGIALAVDIAIYSQAFGTGYRDRYVFLIMPLFLMLAAVAAVAADTLARLRGAGVAFLIALIATTPAFALVPPAREVTALEREAFRSDIADLLASGDYAVVGSSPELVMIYAKQPEYWLISHAGEIALYGRDGRYHYTRSAILETLPELLALENERSVFVMMERDRWRFVSPAIREHIFATYEPYGPEQPKFDVFVKTFTP